MVGTSIPSTKQAKPVRSNAGQILFPEADIINEVNLTPSPASPEDNLNCSYTISDANIGDTLTAEIRWFNNTVLQGATNVSVLNATVNSTLMTSDNLTIGDNWSCGVIPYDQTYFGAQANSSNITILNNPPVIAWDLPTPTNGSTVNESNVYLNTTITDVANTSAFFDWNHSLLGYWSMDFYNSTDVFDNSSYDNFMTFGGSGPTISNITTGKFGNALAFDGVNDYLKTTNNFVGIPTSLTIASWFKKESGGSSYECVLHKGVSTTIGTSSYWLGVDNTDHLTATIGANTGLGWNAGLTTTVATYGQWYHLAAVWDGSVVRVYINGDYDKQYDLTSYSNLATPTRIGASSDGANYQFKGEVDELLILNRALSAEEIKALYNNTVNRLYHNFTGLGSGTYNYSAYAIDELGSLGIDKRNVTIDTNNVPTTPTPGINSTSGDNYDIDDLNCYDILNDVDGNLLNVTVWWYKDGILNLTIDYNNSYASGVLFNATLGSGNTTVGDSWKCGMKLYDGSLDSGWGNSSSLYIGENIPPIITWELPTPTDGSTQVEKNVYLNTTITDETNTSAFFDWNYSLVGYWSMDFYNATGVYDNSTNDNFGTFGGAGFGEEYIMSGKYGDSLEFDGVNDYINLGNTADGDYDAMTIEAWIKRTSDTPSGWRTPLHRNDGTSVGTSVFFIGLEATTHDITATIGAGSGPGYQAGNTNIPAALDTWYHVVNSWNGTTARVYVDGVEIMDYGLTAAAFNNKVAVTRIGASGDGSGYLFKGEIDEVKIYSRALSPGEINASYNNKVYKLYNNFTDLPDGTYNYSAYAIDMGGNTNFSEMRNVIIITNIAPDTPTVNITAVGGDTNYTTQNLNCSASITDDDAAQKLNVSVKWYNNSVLWLSEDYNNSYENGTLFSAVLNSSNTTPSDIWNCSLRLNDGYDFGGWGNSSNITILNLKPTISNVTLTPVNPRSFQSLNCSFNVSDANVGDTLTAEVRWFNNSVKVYAENVSATKDVINSTLFNFTNTSVSEDWWCGVVPYDQGDFGTEVNSSNQTITKVVKCGDIIYRGGDYIVNSTESSYGTGTGWTCLKINVSDVELNGQNLQWDAGCRPAGPSIKGNGISVEGVSGARLENISLYNINLNNFGTKQIYTTYVENSSIYNYTLSAPCSVSGIAANMEFGIYSNNIGIFNGSSSALNSRSYYVPSITNNLSFTGANHIGIASTGFLFSSLSKNSLIKDSYLSGDSQSGIALAFSYVGDFGNVSFHNVTMTNWKQGVWINHGYNSTFTNCTIENNTIGVDLFSGAVGTGKDFTFISNRIQNNSFSGINITKKASSNNTFYNNYINNSVNVFPNSGAENDWNRTSITGASIIGTANLGGNFWATPAKDGWSQTCTDTNSDGFCESPYVIDENNTDYLPLTNNVNVAPNTPTVNITAIGGDTNLTGQNINCSASITDENEHKLNASVKWYNNSVLWLSEDYNNSYENGTLFSAVLNSTNTTPNDIWNCSIKLNDGYDFGGWGNSSNITIRFVIPNLKAYEMLGIPDAPFDSSLTEANYLDYYYINWSDVNDWNTSLATSDGEQDTHVFVFNLSSQVPDINAVPGLNFTWEGYGEVQADYYTNISYWNWSSETWYKVNATDFTSAVGVNISNALVTNMSDFINTTTKEVALLVNSKKYVGGEEVCPGDLCLNSITGLSCNDVCTNNGYASCVSIGNDAGGTNGYSWSDFRGECRGDSISDCSTLQNDVGLTCEDIPAMWTNCLCSNSPFLYKISNNGYVKMSDFIPRAISKDKEYVGITDVSDSEGINGTVKLKITEELDETTYLDQYNLVVYDYLERNEVLFNQWFETDFKKINSYNYKRNEYFILPDYVIKYEINSINQDELTLFSDDDYLIMEKGFERELEFEILKLEKGFERKIFFVAEGYYIEHYKEESPHNSLYTNWVNLSFTDNTIPNTPTVNITAIGGDTNLTGQNINCSASITDDDANQLNVSVKWYNNSVLWLSEDYNTSYENGTLFSAVLNSSNTTRDDIWNCSIGLNDGYVFGGWGNSSNITILNSLPPTYSNIILNATSDNNLSRDNLTLYFDIGEDADGDTVFNITDWRLDGSSIALLNFPFDRNVSDSNGTIRDFSTFENNGTLGNSSAGVDPTWQDATLCKVGGCYHFDGIDDHIQLDEDFDLTSGGTIMGWMKFDDLTSDHGLINLALSSKEELTIWMDENGASDRFGIAVYSGSWRPRYGTTVPDTSSWWHVAFVYTPESGGYSQLYVNGVQEGDNLEYGLRDVAGSSWRIGIGDNGGKPHNGSIDEFKIFNRSLSPEQVYEEYLTGFNNHSTQILVSNETEVGDNWTVAITSSDLEDYGIITNISDGIVITQSNLAPNTPSVNITAVGGDTNYTTQNINCSASITDPESNKLNVSVKWYNNSVLWLSEDYNHSYASGTLFNATLNSSNTTRNDIWNCSIRLDDGYDFGGWGNSSNITILNTPPEQVVLDSPADENSTIDRTETLNWSEPTDVDGDVLTYLVEMDNSDVFSDTGVINVSVGTNEYTIINDLDLDTTYWWRARANDSYDLGEWSEVYNFTVVSVLEVSLINDSPTFGVLYVGQSDNTTDESPPPIVVQNDGNALINISINATSLFDAVAMDTPYYQFRIDNGSEETAFDWLNSFITWTNMATAQVIGIDSLKYQDTNDTAQCEILITIPMDEPHGNKTSNILFEGKLAE